MGFSSNSLIADLGSVRADADRIIRRHSKINPITLFLPATLEDALSEVMTKRILPVVKKTDYLDSVILGLDRCKSQEDFYKVKQNLEGISNAVVIWNDAPEMMELREKELKRYNLNEGKGRNMWFALDYWFITNPKSCFIMHDCDIRTYKKNNIINSLALPLVDPKIRYDFVKAYYERLTGDGNKKMAGRVTRLLVAPLIEALEKVYGNNDLARDYLNYLKGYRYILSGEYGMSNGLASNLPIQPDWGLEIGMVSYLYENRRKIGQVDIGFYDHKHSESGSLGRMAREITKTILRELYNLGVTSIREKEEQQFEAVIDNYIASAKNFREIYRDRSEYSGLEYELQKEIEVVDLFTKEIQEAFKVICTQSRKRIKPLPPVKTVDSKILKRIQEIVWKYNPEVKEKYESY